MQEKNTSSYITLVSSWQSPGPEEEGEGDPPSWRTAPTCRESSVEMFPLKFIFLFFFSDLLKKKVVLWLLIDLLKNSPLFCCYDQ